MIMAIHLECSRKVMAWVLFLKKDLFTDSRKNKPCLQIRKKNSTQFPQKVGLSKRTLEKNLDRDLNPESSKRAKKLSYDPI